MLVLLAVSLSASAQLDAEVSSEARKTRMDMLRQQRIEQKSQELNGKREARSVVSAAAVGDDEVGEASSFNKTAKFFGTATAGFVIVSPSCDPIDLGFELGPDDRCLEITDLAVTTTGVFNEIGRITLPGKKADNVIYLIGNHSTSFVLQNSNSSPVSGLANYTPSITIESGALEDSAAIDPATGLPMNGSYTTTGMGTKSVSRTLAPLSFDAQNESYSRANTNGLSRTFLGSSGTS